MSIDPQRLSAAERVRDFGILHADRFPPSTLEGQQFARLSTEIDRLRRHAVDKYSGKNSGRQATSKKALARQTLRDQLVTIETAASVMAPTAPGLDEKFRIPAHAADAQLLSVARAIADAAAPMQAQFVALGLDADFLDQLARGIDAFTRATAEQGAGRDQRITSRAGEQDALADAFDAVHRLDRLVPIRLKDDPMLLRAWKAARRVGSPASKAATPDEATPTPVDEKPSTT